MLLKICVVTSMHLHLMVLPMGRKIAQGRKLGHLFYYSLALIYSGFHKSGVDSCRYPRRAYSLGELINKRLRFSVGCACSFIRCGVESAFRSHRRGNNKPSPSRKSTATEMMQSNITLAMSPIQCVSNAAGALCTTIGSRLKPKRVKWCSMTLLVRREPHGRR